MQCPYLSEPRQHFDSTDYALLQCFADQIGHTPDLLFEISDYLVQLSRFPFLNDLRDAGLDGSALKTWTINLTDETIMLESASTGAENTTTYAIDRLHSLLSDGYLIPTKVTNSAAFPCSIPATEDDMNVAPYPRLDKYSDESRAVEYSDSDTEDVVFNTIYGSLDVGQYDCGNLYLTSRCPEKSEFASHTVQILYEPFLDDDYSLQFQITAYSSASTPAAFKTLFPIIVSAPEFLLLLQTRQLTLSRSSASNRDHYGVDETLFETRPGETGARQGINS